jgi:hypothetical protein
VVRRLAGLIMLLSFVFLILGGRPAYDDFFGTSDKAEKLQAIRDHPGDWDYANMMFGLAGAVGFAGVALFGHAFNRIEARRRLKQFNIVSVVLVGLGAICWVYVCYARATFPPEDVAADQNIGWWLFPFGPLTISGVALAGYIVSKTYTKWGGRSAMFLPIITAPVLMFLPLLMFVPISFLGLILLMARSPTSKPDADAVAAPA